MAALGDFFEEFKKAKPQEKLLLVGGGLAVVAILLYLHNQSSKQGPFTAPTPASGLASGGGGSAGTASGGVGNAPGTVNPVSTSPTSTPKNPAAPPVGKRPVLRGTPIVAPTKGVPSKQPTTVTRIYGGGKLMPIGQPRPPVVTTTSKGIQTVQHGFGGVYKPPTTNYPGSSGFPQTPIQTSQAGKRPVRGPF